MKFYKAVLESQIMNEKNRTDYITCDADAFTLVKMLSEINSHGYAFEYLAELLEFKISDEAIQIIERYVDSFCSEGTRGYLVSKLDINKRDNAFLIFRLFQHFQESSEYIAAPGKPAPAHIYVRYDNTLCRIRSKKLDQELRAVLRTPRDLCYLPFTTEKLAKRKIFEEKQIIEWYLNSDAISPGDIGLPDDSSLVYYPPLSYFQRQLKFSALFCLRYYPSQEVQSLLTNCAASNDKDLAASAKQSLLFISKGKC